LEPRIYKIKGKKKRYNSRNNRERCYITFGFFLYLNLYFSSDGNDLGRLKPRLRFRTGGIIKISLLTFQLKVMKKELEKKKKKLGLK